MKLATGSDAPVMDKPPLISIGCPGISEPPSNVSVVPVPTSVELGGTVLSFSLNVIEVAVTVTVPLPPVNRLPTTVANDGVAVKKMRPMPDPKRLHRAKNFIGSSYLST